MKYTEYYIARIYTADEWDARGYHDEGIFSSYQKAYDYLIKVFEGHYDHWLGEIACYSLDSDEPEDNVKIWTFSKAGELLDNYDAQNYLNDYIKEETEDGIVYIKKTSPENFTEKFGIGDIVFIKARPWNKHGFPTDVIGVVGYKPISYDKWISEGNDKKDWDDEYRVYYITAGGYLNHIHLEEEGIQLYNQELPSYLSFLKRLVEHFREERVLDQTLLEDIMQNKVFVGKVRHLPVNEF